MTGSMAARRRISRRCDTPDLAADPDLEPVRIVVAAIALVAVDAADRDTCKLFEIGDDGAERVAMIWVAVQRLGLPGRPRAYLPTPARCRRSKCNTPAQGAGR